jgi:hypothetical protein
MLLDILKIPLIITAAVLILMLLIAGREVAAVVAILAVLEVSLSFDNAVVNAKVLSKMSPYWQKLFMTLGIAIAVVGMRLVFPLIIVATFANLVPTAVLALAVNDSGRYAAYLHLAHPAIAAFGGVFLLMIFLDFVFEDRDIYWIGFIERPLIRIGKVDYLAVVIALVTLGMAALTFAAGHAAQVLVAGVFGLATYLMVSSLSAFFEDESIESVARTGLFTFIYLEILDASFSFDGVIGAFAISSQVFVIALGLGIGALFVRSLTVYLVKAGTLAEYVYLEHGAHWAIGALALILLASTHYEVPELVTGLIGVAFIGAAVVSSMRRQNA